MTATTTYKYKISSCQAIEYQKPTIISTGIGFLDHMIDQFYSHAQIGISIHVLRKSDHDDTTASETQNQHSIEYINRYANDNNQMELLSVVGTAIGTELRSLLDTAAQTNSDIGTSPTQHSAFACPLDEAFTLCTMKRSIPADPGSLTSYTLSPYGIYPNKTGRTHIGSLKTEAIIYFWKELSLFSGLHIDLFKMRGHNAHHIVESSFKAFARALRNFIDHINTITAKFDPNNSMYIYSGTNYGDGNAIAKMYGHGSHNHRISIDLHRHALIVRNTKETSIRTEIHFDGGMKGVQIDTGILVLNEFLTIMAMNANISLHVQCKGDLYIDEHHTAEDVAISIGQVLHDALGDKAGLNRMWSTGCIYDTDNSNHYIANQIHVVMDISNRPCLTHNLGLVLNNINEMIDDLSCEMFEHVLESIVTNARMTVHIALNGNPTTTTSTTIDDNDTTNPDVGRGLVMAIGKAFGQALYYCSMVDHRRAGTTASSKGTLSV